MPRPAGLLALLFAIGLPACGEVEDASATAPTSGDTSSEASSDSTGTSGDTPTSTQGPVTETGGSEGATEGATTGPTSGDETTSTTGTDTSTTSPVTSTDGTTSTTSTSTTSTTSDTTGDETTGTTGEPSNTDCLLEGFANPDMALKLDYDQFGPVIGSHCKGTNHQDITDIERVVFLGDSVTVGTPPQLGDDYYRSKLADVLVDRFGLTPPNPLWKQANPIDGVALVKESGDFVSCSKWGARTDDFLPPGNQVNDCFPPDMFDKRTLVITTMGGNDIAAIAKDGANGTPLDEVKANAAEAADLLRQTAHWFVDDPEKFPNGVFLVFANVYEFTDGTADLMACPAAGLGGFDKPWQNPAELIDVMIGFNEEFMSVAVETGTDMIFMLENFCGHGFKAGDPSAPCYRGPGQQNWFDLTCIHPTAQGHTVITDLFTAVIDE
ncbi:SGNH/GDSL hydrolase family protein [Nannocystis punicea]|uniref:SGNH/GDSL hydrolase family protein n=1 Tax=Nannocystis punicea TaxID=2995304 RepID=A0ABY7HII9_9BACT|nr:SGNH/GDSL hydrolase family protein [Nannocystis poenicansa]WAS98764.1 SGNH/GDSL hydrolase family protein [Nannocystis poenicansa]